MVKVYAAVLAVGFVALLVVVMGGALAENLGRSERDPGTRVGPRGREALGASLGFGMGGMAAEFAPLGLSWPVALAVAVVAAGGGLVWVRYSNRVAAET